VAGASVATGASVVGAPPHAARTNAEISRRLNSKVILFFITSSPYNIGLLTTIDYQMHQF
jgi:hypothetical protein